ncbi:MAG TPA: hypothetical protein VLM40_17005 [Gemmata sp.]|nr:hypothetical protein [Gemmata sp.]
MGRFGLPIGIVLAALILGCGPGKELPQQVIEPVASRPIPVDPLGKAPAESDPEAKAVLERAVKAITQGDIKRLESLKACIVNYRGRVHFPNIASATDATLVLEVQWPTRARATFGFQGVFPTITFRYIEPFGWMNRGGQEQEGDQSEVGRFIRNDFLLRCALPLGIPLADPHTIAFEAKKDNGVATVKVATRDAPLMLVTFDAKTGLPTGVESHPLELTNQRTKKTLTFSEHKPQDGLLLPTKVESTENGRPAETWTLDKLQFLDKIDPAVFEKPK